MKKLLLASLYVMSISTLISFTSLRDEKSETRSYKVIPEKSKVVWTGKKVTGEHTGNVNISKGNISLLNNKLTDGSFDIDLSSLTVVDITDPATNAKLLTHLKGDDFFATQKYPIAQLDITSVAPKSKDNYEVTGNLTIKGITQPVTFPAVVTHNGNVLSASADILIDRTKYDIKYRSSDFFENLGD